VTQRPLSVLTPARSTPEAHHSSSCAGTHAYLFPFSSLFVGVAAGCSHRCAAGAAMVVTLDASWDLSMDCLSCGGDCACACVALRPVSVLTPAGSTPWAVVPCGALALALTGTQQPTQNWCGSRGMTN
jgi:hypothetical protein